MDFFMEKADTHLEVLEKVRMKYGDKAQIMSKKTVPAPGLRGLFGKEQIEVSGYVYSVPGARMRTAPGEGIRPAAPRKKLNDDEEREKILKSVKEDKTLKQVLEEVQFIRSHIGEGQGGAREHENILEIEKLLEDNDFSSGYIRGITERLKKDLSLEELDDKDTVQEKVVDWIGESLEVHDFKLGRKPQVLILVGPTGVGKTTTIAKLAAIYGLPGENRPAREVRLITIDNYRIGAQKQIETYGDIMRIPVSCVESYAQLEQKMALYQDVDLVLIDTIGKSPNDYRKLAEMRELLDGCGNRAEVFLTISASTKVSDAREIFQQFETFKYSSVILTKLDETTRVGNIISVLCEKRKSLAYITDGQVVPQDIQRAKISRLLTNLDGFRINRSHIEERFDSADPGMKSMRA